MKHIHRAFWGWLGRHLRRQFLAGILAVVPLSVTIVVLVWVFNTVDNYLQPIIKPILGHSVPGIGFGIMIVVIYLVGVIGSNVVGKRLISYGDSLVARVPVVRPLYLGVKQLMDSFSTPGAAGFMQTVLLEFPKKGIWTIGFVTKESPAPSGETLLNVFVPTAPNPMSGFLQIVGEGAVIRTDISVEKALRMVVSAGRVSPEEVSEHLSGRTAVK